MLIETKKINHCFIPTNHAPIKNIANKNFVCSKVFVSSNNVSNVNNKNVALKKFKTTRFVILID